MFFELLSNGSDEVAFGDALFARLNSALDC